MADITITPANVAIGESDVDIGVYQAGEALVQGDVVYLKDSDSKVWKAQADVTADAKFEGIVLTPAATDGYVVLLRRGKIIIGGTVVAAEAYALSTNAGKIAPSSDLVSTNQFISIGSAPNTTTIDVRANDLGVLP